MHTAATEHHSPIDHVQISPDARRMSFEDQLKQVDINGNPAIKGNHNDDGVTNALAACAIFVMAIASAIFGFFYWLTGSIGGAIFLSSILILIVFFINLFYDKPNNGEVK